MKKVRIGILGCANIAGKYAIKSFQSIGNAEVGAEKFAAAKKMLLSHLQKELDAKAGVGINIFNIDVVLLDFNFF